jgi:hypothetical protein
VTKPITDIDGREIPPPEPGSDLAVLERLMLFGRREHFGIGPLVKVGSITVQIVDLDQPKRDTAQDLGAWATMGGYDGK